jgi:hypothetical protein
LPADRWASSQSGSSSPAAPVTGRMAPMKRQRKCGSPEKTKKGPKLLSRPLTKDSFRKAVEIMPDGSRKVSLSPDAIELLENQREMFREKFGREPGPSDPICFDADADEPKDMPPLDLAALESIRRRGRRPSRDRVAMAKTGVLLMKENEHLYSDEDKAEFQAAVEEYRETAKRLDA